MPVIQNGDEIFEKFFLISVCEHKYYLKMLKNQKSKIRSLALCTGIFLTCLGLGGDG